MYYTEQDKRLIAASNALGAQITAHNVKVTAYGYRPNGRNHVLYLILNRRFNTDLPADFPKRINGFEVTASLSFSPIK